MAFTARRDIPVAEGSGCSFSGAVQRHGASHSRRRQLGACDAGRAGSRAGPTVSGSALGQAGARHYTSDEASPALGIARRILAESEGARPGALRRWRGPRLRLGVSLRESMAWRQRQHPGSWVTLGKFAARYNAWWREQLRRQAWIIWVLTEL